MYVHVFRYQTTRRRARGKPWDQVLRQLGLIFRSPQIDKLKDPSTNARTQYHQVIFISNNQTRIKIFMCRFLLNEKKNGNKQQHCIFLHVKFFNHSVWERTSETCVNSLHVPSAWAWWERMLSQPAGLPCFHFVVLFPKSTIRQSSTSQEQQWSYQTPDTK